MLSIIRAKPNITAPTPAAHCMADSISNYAYAKEQLPSFNGEIHRYPAWKKEWKECILLNRGDAYGLRAMNRYTPESIDIQNCLDVEEAGQNWMLSTQAWQM